ncbi:hypothetical protein Tco_1273494 [Tanacetum coccineum]
MDDEPTWAVDRVVALTPGSAITIPETANEFAIKGNSNSDTNKIMARMDALTIKMDAQYKELQSCAKKPTPNLDEDDIPMSREKEAKFMQTFHNWRSSGRNDYNRDNYRSNTDDKSYDLEKQFNNFMKSQQLTNAFVKETFMDLKTQLETIAKNHQASIQNLETKFDRLADKQSGRPSGSLPRNTQPNPRVIRVKQKQLNLGVGTERMIFNINSTMKHSYSNDDTCFSIDVIDGILEEVFDVLLDEGSKILHSIKGTLLEEEIFSEFDEFMEMTADENSKSESDTEDHHSRKSPSTPIIKSRHLLKNLLRISNSNLFLII